MPVELKWQKADWPDKTYHASADGLSYTVNHNGSRWVVRGWKNGKSCLYEGGPTMGSMRKTAEAHAEQNSNRRRNRS